MLRLGYVPPSENHGKIHDSVLRSLEMLFGSTTTKIGRVMISTKCLHKSREKGCFEIVPQLSKVVENNRNIGKFIFDIGRSDGRPFYDHYLLE